MPSDNSANKGREDLLAWGQRDLGALVDYTLALQAENGRLKDAAAQNSSNSSRPPSTDRNKPSPKSQRTSSGRKPGGQKDHAGSTLPLSPKPEHTQVHPLLECAECGQDLSGVPAQDYQARQVYDLPELKLQCTEHRAEVKECPCCHCQSAASFPEEIKAPVQYGKNFRSLIAYLYDAQVGASRRIRTLCQEMFGFPVSEATLQAARQELYQSLQPFEERLKEVLPHQPVLCADETQVALGKAPYWVHVLCTPLLTFLSLQLRRGREAIEAIGVIPRFAGWLMHDFLSSYLSFDNCLHTFCKSHLMRELVFLFEQRGQAWAKELHDLFLEMLRQIKERKARDAPLSQGEYKRWHERYWRILQAGRQANPQSADQQSGKCRKQTKEQNLLDRLEGYDQAILAFLWAWDVPFTNNEAERSFRMLKVRMKVSGCFRTEAGAQRHLRIFSYISTLRKNGLPVLQYLRHALDGNPFLPLGSKSS